MKTKKENKKKSSKKETQTLLHDDILNTLNGTNTSS